MHCTAALDTPNEENWLESIFENDDKKKQKIETHSEFSSKVTQGRRRSQTPVSVR